MQYIKQEFLTVAKGRSKDLFRMLLTLSKFAVVGVMTDGDFDIVCNYLRDIGAKFGSNAKNIIWLNIYPKSLQRLHTKYKNK